MKTNIIAGVLALLLHSFSMTAQKNTMSNKKTATPAVASQKENEFGMSIFKALQKKDLAAWVALYPTNTEYGGILQVGLAAKAEGLTQQIIDDILSKREKEAAAVYSAQFTHYCQQADSLGINWQTARFERFDFTAVYPEPVPLKYLGATLRLTSKGKRFLVEGIQAVEIASGYKLQALTGLREADSWDK